MGLLEEEEETREDRVDWEDEAAATTEYSTVQYLGLVHLLRQTDNNNTLLLI